MAEQKNNEYYYVRNKKGAYLANVPKPAEPGIWFCDEDAAYPFQNIEEASEYVKIYDGRLVVNIDV